MLLSPPGLGVQACGQHRGPASSAWPLPGGDPDLVQEGPPPSAEEGLDLLQRPALGLRHAAAGEQQVDQADGSEEEERHLKAKGILGTWRECLVTRGLPAHSCSSQQACLGSTASHRNCKCFSHSRPVPSPRPSGPGRPPCGAGPRGLPPLEGSSLPRPGPGARTFGLSLGSDNAPPHPPPLSLAAQCCHHSWERIPHALLPCPKLVYASLLGLCSLWVPPTLP